WDGILPFLLFSRGQLKIERVDLFDLDPKAVENARLINERWLLKDQFAAHLGDINQSGTLTSESDLWINTSCEHFVTQNWWTHLPAGHLVALQGTDMVHEEHVSRF